jgi:hypothetical protein
MSADPAAKTRAGNEAHTMTNAMRPARMRFISTGISIWDLDAASHQHQAGPQTQNSSANWSAKRFPRCRNWPVLYHDDGFSALRKRGNRYQYYVSNVTV